MSTFWGDKSLIKRIKRMDKRLLKWVKLQGAGNLSIGTSIYLDAVNDLKKEVLDMYYFLADKKLFSKFFNEMKCWEFYKSSRSLRTAVSNLISRNYQKIMRYKCYYRIRKIVNKYNKWRKQNDTSIV